MARADHALSSRPVTHLPGVSRCMIHDIDEPVDPSTFIVCRTCGHVYASAEDLVDAYNLAVDWMNSDPRLAFIPHQDHVTVDKADTIEYCQVCVHDF